MSGRSSSTPPVQPLRAKLRQATASAILDATEAVLAEQGPEPHVGDIAARAGVAVGTLYNYFADRDALVEALVAERKEAVLRALEEAVERTAQLPVREALAAALETYYDGYRAHRPLMQYLMQGDLARYGLGRVPPASYKYLLDQLGRILKRGVKERVLRADGLATYPMLLMGLVRASMMRDLHTKEGLIPVEELVAFFLHGAAA